MVKKAMTEKMEELDREVANYKTVATALDELDAKVASLLCVLRALGNVWC